MKEAKQLGVIISSDLKWNAHVDSITCKVGQHMYNVMLLKRAGVYTSDILQMYTCIIRPVLEYADEAWHPGQTQYLERDIRNVLKRSCYIIYPDLEDEDALKGLISYS